MSLLQFAVLDTGAQRSTYCNAGSIPPRCNLGSRLGLSMIWTDFRLCMSVKSLLNKLTPCLELSWILIGKDRR